MLFFFSGNESHIKDIISKLHGALQAKNLVDPETSEPLLQHDEQLRKIAFYLILNTEASFKHNLIDDHSVCHLVKTAPQLTKGLLLACIWGLKLDKYFYECITYTPTWFAYGLVEDAVDSLKYGNPYEVLERTDFLVRSIYSNIARSDYRAMDIAEKRALLSKFYDISVEFIRQFFAPDAEKFEKWSKNRIYKYTGYVIKHILELILFCFDVFRNRPAFLLESPAYEVYQVMREQEKLADVQNNGYSEAVDGTLKKINMILLNSLQYNVMEVMFEQS